MASEPWQIIIVGGGIAGASAAYFLARRGLRVLVLEREGQPGEHSSGRSAAVLAEHHRLPVVQRLIVAGGRFLRQPPPGLSEHPLVDEAGVLVPAAGEAWDALAAEVPDLRASGTSVQVFTRDQALARVPVCRQLDGALFLDRCGHLDVHALLSGYLRGLRAAGGELRCGCEVGELYVEAGCCRGVVTASGDELRSERVVNAAGAWAGVLGSRVGALPISFEPRRRSIITFAAPPDLTVARWPMVDYDADRLYFKPESGGLLASPMDQTPVPPCDARPVEDDVADAVDKLSRLAPALVPGSIRRRWAGLRTFAPDEIPVVGGDPRLPGFFWLAGQGGVGIETSPVLGQVAADLIVDGSSSYPDAPALSPARFTIWRAPRAAD
jgi:D-arginine dehydrogenase